MGSLAVLVDGLLRLVCPFIATCMNCLVVSVVCSSNLALPAVLKQVVMYGYCMDERSCSDVGPGGRVSRECLLIVLAIV